MPDSKSTKMKKRSKKRSVHWCFTLINEDADCVNTTSRSGKDVTLSEKMCRIYICQKEMANDEILYTHRNCLLHVIQPGGGHNRTQGQAVIMIKEFLPDLKMDINLKKLSSSVNDFLHRYWRSEIPVKNKVEQILTQSLEKIKATGMAVTGKRFKRQVIMDAGPTFYQKNKAVCDIMLSEPDLFQPGRKIPFECNSKTNFLNMFKATILFEKQIKKNLYKNSFITSHKTYSKLNVEEMSELIVFLALLPIVLDRWEGVDGLPALYLYGVPHSGKSYMFTACPYYRKIATDATGVSRFLLQGCENSWLLDDVKMGCIDEPSNSSVLRDLTIGGEHPVKVMGDTMNVRGFVVVTSNDKPPFLGDVPTNYTGNWEMNCMAWKRRFVAINMTETLDVNPLSIKWDHKSTGNAALVILKELISKFKNPKLQADIKMYKDHIDTMLIEENWPKFNTCYKDADNWIKSICEFSSITKDMPARAPDSFFNNNISVSSSVPGFLHSLPASKRDLLCPDECYMVHKHVRINQDGMNDIMYNKNQIRKDEDICGDRNLLDKIHQM